MKNPKRAKNLFKGIVIIVAILASISIIIVTYELGNSVKLAVDISKEETLIKQGPEVITLTKKQFMGIYQQGYLQGIIMGQKIGLKTYKPWRESWKEDSITTIKYFEHCFTKP